MFITGPDSLPTNGTDGYTIRIIGGPAETGGNWSFLARIENPIPTGADVDPSEGNSTENTFLINVTAPSDDRPITLVVNGTSANRTDEAWSGDVLKEIEIFKPVIVNITVTVRNPSQIDVKGAVIAFYVDGLMIGNTTEDVSANTTKEVYMEWVTSKDDEGEHEIEVRINENGALLEFNDGDNVLRKTVYVGERPEREMETIMIFNSSGLVAVIEIIGIFFLIGAYLMRRNTLRGRSHYSSSATNVMYFEGLFMIVLSIPVFVVSQIIADNPDVFDDPSRSPAWIINGIAIFIFGFLTILLTWDRSRKKRR
ncbi:MAG: hypothetical protein JSV56_06080 [Methanomassiliicoccales archaeon]|nr:MAG: hypothetical protein JSV56_06080 [Methanomassiliicoccales archaeon]